jgi:predicted nucleic acid-binding protein
MNDKVFIDTNVLIYLYSDSERDKQGIARKLVFETNLDISISTQVIGEFSNILYRKYGYSLDIIKEAVDDFKNNFKIVVISVKTIERSFEIMKVYGYSYWDSVIIAPALEYKCPILYSEDLQHNQKIEENLRIVNPFSG